VLGADRIITDATSMWPAIRGIQSTKRRQRLHTTVSLMEYRRAIWDFATFAAEQTIENVVHILEFATVSTAGSNQRALHTVVKLHYKFAMKPGIISVLSVNSSTLYYRHTT